MEVTIMSYDSEARFEADLIRTLVEEKGWKDGVLQYKDEKDLIQNWANIIYENNRSVDRLGDYPITQGEMQQILEQIAALRTPMRLNGFINGKPVQIKSSTYTLKNTGEVIEVPIVFYEKKKDGIVIEYDPNCFK